MTVFDLEKEELGDWFAFFTSEIDMATGEIVYAEPEENAAEFRIRGMDPFWEKLRKNRKKESKMVLNPVTKMMERVVWYEDLPQAEADKEADDAWDYAITGIKNAFSATDVEIECNRENKQKLIKVQVFIRFLSRVFQIINEAGITRKESSEKN